MVYPQAQGSDSLCDTPYDHEAIDKFHPER